MTFQQSIDKIISEIIHNNINPWFLNWEKSRSNAFQDQLKILLSSVFVKLGLGLGKMDKMHFVTCITQKLKSHLRHYRNIEGSVGEISEIPIEKYLKLSRKILNYSLPRKDSRSDLLTSFLNEILAGTILPLLIRKISNPHFINTIMKSSLSISESTPKMKIKDLYLLDILKKGIGLLEFIQFLKDQNAYPMIQFYYAVDSYKKIFEFMQEKAQKDSDKSKHALEIFKIFFSSNASSQSRIYLHGNDELIKKTLDNIQDNVDSKVFDPILKCILGLLEDRYLPVFKKSTYYTEYLKGSLIGNSPGLKRKIGCRNLEIVLLFK